MRNASQSFNLRSEDFKGNLSVADKSARCVVFLDTPIKTGSLADYWTHLEVPVFDFAG